METNQQTIQALYKGVFNPSPIFLMLKTIHFHIFAMPSFKIKLFEKQNLGKQLKKGNKAQYI